MPDIFDGSSEESEQPVTPPTKEKVLESVREKRAEKSAHKKKRTVDDYSQVMVETAPSHSPFAAYAAKPTRTGFSSQAHGEQIILLLRKHPITQIKWIVIALIVSILPIIFSGVPLLGFLPANFQFAALIGWYLLLMGFILESFLTWFYNVYIITDERVIDVDFLSLIYHDVSAAKIDNIEDVTSVTGGAIRSVFDFGTIRIQTAAEKTEFEFEDVPHPIQVTKLLNELILEEEREKAEGRVS